MKNQILLAIATWLVVTVSVGSSAYAQHCPPITESYLSTSRVGRTEDGLRFRIGYSKTGGRPKKSYQAYVLAYASSKSEEIAAITPQEAIEKKLATIVHTQLALFADDKDAKHNVQQTDEDGEYFVDYELTTEKFVEAMLEAKQIEATTNVGGWQRYDDELRLALFIPFLDDKKYAVLDGLPDDRHECNYSRASALLFQPLTHKLTVSFGIVRAFRIADGKHFIELNGKRGIKAAAR